MVTTQQRTAPRSFDEVFRSIAHVDGWMTRAQALRLWDRSARLRRGGVVVEIGSFRGRSAIVLAAAAPEGVEVVTIDPHGGNDRGPQQLEGFELEGQEDHVAYLENLRAAGVADRVRHVRLPSQEALGEVPEAIDLLYIDGAHRYAPALADIRAYGARVAPGGTLLIHDSFSSVGVTLAIATELATSSTFRYEGRSGSLAEYRRSVGRRYGGRTRLASALGQAAQLPWFVRNLLIKVLLVLGLGRVARLLGSDGSWPY